MFQNLKLSQRFLITFSAITKYQIMIIRLLKGQFKQKSKTKTNRKKKVLARCFSIFYFGTRNSHALKLLVKVLLVEIFEAVN